MKVLRIGTLIALIASAMFAAGSQYNYGDVNTASWTSATSEGTAVTSRVESFSTVVVSLQSSSITDGAIAFEATDDGTNWYRVAMVDSATATPELFAGLSGVGGTTAGRPRLWQGSVAGYLKFRVRLAKVISGSGTAALRVQSSAAPLFPIVSDTGYVMDTNDGWAVLNMYLLKRNRTIK